MKSDPCLFSLRSALSAITLAAVALPAALPAATNSPTGAVNQASSSIFRGVDVYSIRYPGGTVSDFFKFLRANGFTNDTVLFAGQAGEVHVPQFTVANVQLKEVAKSLEFVAEGNLAVELIEKPQAGDVNVWRIKTLDRPVSAQIKTRACAVPRLLTGEKGKERVLQIVQETLEALLAGSEWLTQDQPSYLNHSWRPPQGSVAILKSEKVVVAVGAEAYVEAIASALEAAEKASVPILPGPR